MIRFRLNINFLPVIFSLLSLFIPIQLAARHSWEGKSYEELTLSELIEMEKLGVPIPASKHLPTNYQLVLDMPKGTIGFMQEFEVGYTFKNQDKIIDVIATNFDFDKTSLDILSVEIASNSFKLRIKSYEVSNFLLPAFLVTGLKDGKTNRFYSPQIPINHQQIGSTNMQLLPIFDIYEFKDWRWLWWVLGGLVIIGISVWVIARFMRKRRQEIELDERWRRDPYTEATARLNRLKAMEVTNQNVKDYFVELSEITRQFLEYVLEFQALEMSTSEIKNYLKANQTDKDLLEISMTVLNLCDRVKYARYIPEIAQTKFILEQGYNLVELARQLYQKQDTTKEISSSDLNERTDLTQTKGD